MSRWLSLNSDVRVTQNQVHTSEREARLKESVVVASPPGYKAAPPNLPPSNEAFVSRLMVQVNCTGDSLWGNRWAQMCSKNNPQQAKKKT